MLDLQFSTRKEIWEAKKILYESDSVTKRSFIISVLTFIFLLILLLMSILGTSDQWNCEIESTQNNLKYQYICTEARSTINCKSITGPIHAQIFLNINKNIKANAQIVCPWEIAISELRVCFLLLALISTSLSLIALKKENKRFAELHFQAGIFLAALLLISSIFDFLAISNSGINNYNFCNLKDEFQVDKGIFGEMDCTFTFYYATAFFEFISSTILLYSAYAVNQWKRKITTQDI